MTKPGFLLAYDPPLKDEISTAGCKNGGKEADVTSEKTVLTGGEAVAARVSAMLE